MSEEELAEFRKQLGAEAQAEYDEMLAATELDLKQILINEGLGFLAEASGFNDAKACIMRGNVEACLWTLASVLPVGKIATVVA